MKSIEFKNRSLLTKVFGPGLLLALLLPLSLALSAENAAVWPTLDPETNVCDAPIDTREVVMDYYFECISHKVSMKPEAESKDYPFNTACIMQNYSQSGTIINTFTSPDCALAQANASPTTSPRNKPLPEKTMRVQSLVLPPEGDAKDVPFDTAKVVAQFMGNSDDAGKGSINSLGQVLAICHFDSIFKASFITLLSMISFGILAFVFFAFIH